MEDCVSSPATMMGASTDLAMDFGYMDELLLEGCWLETTDGSEFLQQNPNNSSGFLDHPHVWPNSENADVDLTMNQSQERQRSLFPANLPVHETQGKIQSLGRNVANVAGCFDQSESAVIGGSEVGRRWWIGPRANPGSGISVMERLIWALGCIKDFTRDSNALIQLWVPVNRGGTCVLTTNNQPFSLDPSCPRLVGYRDISVNYQFPADKNSKELVGLPGRVFLGKVPEWTPDVRFFRSDEYSRVGDAQRYDVRGTLALPVFEQGSRTCLGVLEVVMTTQRIKYRTELESVCRALEAVDLRSSEPSDTVNVEECNMSYQAIFPEIQEVLRAACETHRLPLAQTWVPCIQQGKGGCRHSDENYARCVSTVDCASYVADPDFHGFHEACSEHHLLKGQGVAGGAFLTNQPCFWHDITSFSKTEYPLSHHARMFGLRAAVAIRLRSIYTGKADFVLEFFLPVDCVDPEEQRKMLGSLSTIIQQVCQSLRVVTDKEMEEEVDLPVSEVVTPSGEAMSKVECTRLERRSPEDLSWDASLTEIQQSGNVVSPLQKEELMVGDKSPENRHHNQDSSLEESPDIAEDQSTFGDFSSISKIGERRRTKAEKTITLQVLRQYFAGSLKDAAKSIGVCPTTLKRICRQHGIKRWPSRKIKKVGHSLQKLQLVIDSVQGTSGAMQIGSFYSNFPELASPNLSGSSPLSTSKLNDHPKQPEVSNFSPPIGASKSPSSSCSQNSSSSQFGSSGTHPHPSEPNIADSENPVVLEDSVGMLKKVRSDAELYAWTKQGPNLMTRSHSHKALSNHPIGAPTLANGGQESREGNAQRVKVAYGDENIRFRMQSNWGFNDLLQEIARRFSIDDMSRFDLKYLDDDSEWILLTCNADLEECVDICRSSQGETIRLCLQASHHLGSSFGNSAPS